MTIEVFQIAEPGGETFDGREQYDQITLKYQCKTDGSYADSVALVTALISGGHVKGPGGELSSGSAYRARTLKARSLDTAKKLWAVEQQFDNQTVDAEISEQQDPSRHDPAAPENDTATLEIVSQIIQRPSMHDARGCLAINTAFDLFDPVPELLFVMRSYRWTFNSTSQTSYDELEGTTNNADVTMAGQTIPERAGVVTEVSIDGPHIRQYQTALGVTANATYYRNSITFEVLDAPLPSTITLLDPTVPSFTTGTLPTFAEFQKSGGSPFTYVPHGNLISNKGFHQLVVDAPATWSSGSDYEIGDRVVYSGNRYKAIQASTSSSPQQPDTSPSYWTQYGTGTSKTIKQRIVNSDVDPTVADDKAGQPVDLPHWLDDHGQLMTTEEAMQDQYAMFQQTARAADWTTFPMVT